MGRKVDSFGDDTLFGMFDLPGWVMDQTMGELELGLECRHLEPYYRSVTMNCIVVVNKGQCGVHMTCHYYC